jgi:hypothetical protein
LYSLDSCSSKSFVSSIGLAALSDSGSFGIRRA